MCFLGLLMRISFSYGYFMTIHVLIRTTSYFIISLDAFNIQVLQSNSKMWHKQMNMFTLIMVGIHYRGKIQISKCVKDLGSIYHWLWWVSLIVMGNTYASVFISNNTILLYRCICSDTISNAFQVKNLSIKNGRSPLDFCYFMSPISLIKNF